MSGDVQPRKRKDKKRRKDDEDGGTTLLRSSSTEQSENVTIHVHKETGTGGHWFAKIVFFVLLAGLLAVIGLIFVEHRGDSDVDTPVTTSQWAMIFEGWVDESTISHDEEPTLADDEQSHEVEEHAETEDNGEDPVGKDREEAVDDEECSQAEVNAAEDDDGFKDNVYAEDISGHTQDKTMSEEEEEAADEGFDDEVETQDEHDDKIVEDADFDLEDDDESAEKMLDYESSEKGRKYSSDNVVEGYGESLAATDDDDDDLGALEEVEDDEDELGDRTTESYGIDLDISIEGVRYSDEEEDVQHLKSNEEYIEILGVNDNENSAEPFEEVDGGEPQEIIDDDELNQVEEAIQEELEEESTSVTMKFGVGVALIITAHFVLVRRWNYGDADVPEILAGSANSPRRNTIISSGRIERKEQSKSCQKVIDNDNEKNEDIGTSSPECQIVKIKEKKRTGIQEIFAKKTADLEMVLRGSSKDTGKKIVEIKNEQTADEAELSENEQDYENDCEEYDDEIENDGQEFEREEDDADDWVEEKYEKLEMSEYTEGDDEETDGEKEEAQDDEEEIDYEYDDQVDRDDERGTTTPSSKLQLRQRTQKDAES